MGQDAELMTVDDVVIDIHCHFQVAEADELIAPHRAPGQEPLLAFASAESSDVTNKMLCTIRPKLSSFAERLVDMNAAGIDIQLVSPAPFQYFYWGPAAVVAQTSRIVNDWIANRVREYPTRFVGLGTVALQDTDLAIAELERCVKELGLHGVEIGARAEGDELSHPRLRPFFAAAEALGALIFIHPHGVPDGARLGKHYLINLIGNPLDTTIAASYLIFDGVMRDFPKLKICLAHGGGYLAAYSGRMDHAHRYRADCRTCISEPPSHYMKQFYFDTVVYTPHQIEYLCDEYGVDRVLLGTDYPYDMGEPDPVGLINATKFDHAVKGLLRGGNARRLLGLSAEQVVRARAERAQAKAAGAANRR